MEKKGGGKEEIRNRRGVVRKKRADEIEKERTGEERGEETRVEERK